MTLNHPCEMMDDDPVRDLLLRVQRVMPTFSGDQILTVESEFRQVWACCNIYIAKGMSNRKETRAELKKRLQEKGVKAVMAEGVSLSRSTLYSILKS